MQIGFAPRLNTQLQLFAEQSTMTTYLSKELLAESTDLRATWQLRTVTRALLTDTTRISFAPNQSLERERPPLGGYQNAPVILS